MDTQTLSAAKLVGAFVLMIGIPGLIIAFGKAIGELRYLLALLVGLLVGFRVVVPQFERSVIDPLEDDVRPLEAPNQ